MKINARFVSRVQRTFDLKRFRCEYNGVPIEGKVVFIYGKMRFFEVETLSKSWPMYSLTPERRKIKHFKRI